MSYRHHLIAAALAFTALAPAAHANEALALLEPSTTTQDGLADLVPVGAALEMVKICGQKSSTVSNLVAFKGLAEKSYVMLTQKPVQEVRDAFAKGAKEAQGVKAKLDKDTCKKTMGLVKEFDAKFVNTNAALKQLMSTFQDYQKTNDKK